jgi:hypothetical protein
VGSGWHTLLLWSPCWTHAILAQWLPGNLVLAVAKLLVHKGCHRVPVINMDGEVVNIISQSTIVKFLEEHNVSRGSVVVFGTELIALDSIHHSNVLCRQRGSWLRDAFSTLPRLTILQPLTLARLGSIGWPGRTHGGPVGLRDVTSPHRQAVRNGLGYAQSDGGQRHYGGGCESTVRITVLADSSAHHLAAMCCTTVQCTVLQRSVNTFAQLRGSCGFSSIAYTFADRR